jgi:hypothetical protein
VPAVSVLSPASRVPAPAASSHRSPSPTHSIALHAATPVPAPAIAAVPAPNARPPTEPPSIKKPLKMLLQ